MANYIARPTKEIIIDDGVDQQKYFELEGVLEGGVPLAPVQIKAEDFADMDWMIPCWGIRANMQPNPAIKEIIRNVIQSLGRNVVIETIYAHTGWRKVNGKWSYLHAKGCIGADNVKVAVDSSLDSYYFPTCDEDPKDSLAASLALLYLAPSEVTTPLLAQVFLAPLSEFLRAAGCEPNFVLWLYGRTGSRKTSLATLFLSHFREYSKSPPATFKDTVNALERKAFHCKDSILLIDDYHPSDSKFDKDKMNLTAQYIGE